MRTDFLPPEFAPLKITTEVYKKTPNEYATACPKCGGKDRFCMVLNSKTTGGAFGWCRQCDFKWWQEKNGEQEKLSVEQLAELNRQHEERLKKAIADAQQALAEIRQNKKWIEYHENLVQAGRQAWYDRGLQDFFIDYWELGYNPEYALWKMVQGDWQRWHLSQTLTIPVWDVNREAQNIKHRLLNLPEGPGNYRYRYEKRDLGDPAFYCSEEKSGPCVLCEGEIKSQVLYQEIIRDGLQVVGTASMMPSDKTLAGLENYEPIYYIPDPDAFDRDKAGSSSAGRVAKQLGLKRTRVISLPDKIDDMINAGQIGRHEINGLMKTARRY